MISPDYHIDQLLRVNPIAQIRVYFINFITFFYRKTHLSLHTGLVNKYRKTIIQRLNKTYVLTEGLKSIVRDYDRDQAIRQHDGVETLLIIYRLNFAKIENDDYAVTPLIKSLFEKIIENLYQIEFELRRKAFTDNPVLDDKTLTEHAAHLSLSSQQEP